MNLENVKTYPNVSEAVGNISKKEKWEKAMDGTLEELKSYEKILFAVPIKKITITEHTQGTLILARDKECLVTLTDKRLLLVSKNFGDRVFSDKFTTTILLDEMDAVNDHVDGKAKELIIKSKQRVYQFVDTSQNLPTLRDKLLALFP